MKLKAFVNGTILTVTKGTIEKGEILISEGKFQGVGSDLEIPAGADTTNLKGKYVVPGFVDPHCHVGIVPEKLDWEYGDVNEKTDPITPQLHALDGIDFADPGFDEAVKGGVTSVIIHPGSANVIGGTSVAVKTAGESLKERIIRNPAGVKMAMGRKGKQKTSKRPYPRTKMGTAYLLRKSLSKAREYMEKKGENEKVDLGLETLASVLEGKIPARVHAMKPDDILTMVRISKEFNFRFTAEHVTEGQLIAEKLAQERIPVVYGPLLYARRSPTLRQMTDEAPKILVEKGVLLSFQTDHPVVPINLFRLMAMVAIRNGMKNKEALKALTINGAKILGAEDRIGSIEEGKDADFSIFTEHPLKITATVKKTFINGKEVYNKKSGEEESAKN